MTHVVSALFAFGFNLGGTEADERWQFKEVDHNNFARLPWYTDDSNDDEMMTFSEIANKFIARELGHIDRLTAVPEHDREKVALRAAGVQVIPTGFEGERSFLSAHAIVATPDADEPINLRTTVLKQVQENWSSRLAIALRVMGITPVVDHPRWMLIANYD